MTEYVVDASALVTMMIGTDTAADDLRARWPSLTTHAPHLIDAEVGNVLRRHERAALISTSEAVTALSSIEYLVDHRYPQWGPLGAAAWALRADVTFYDALYVGLAGRLGVPLMTADAKLAEAPSLGCTFELV